MPTPIIINTNIMKNIIIQAKRIILATALLATAVACSKDDDIGDIFIDRDWKLSFVQDGNIRRSSAKEYSIRFQENTFEALLPGGKNIRGNWKANGDTREFSCSNLRESGNLKGDTIAEKMRQILTKAQKYEGDTHYLKIKEQDNIYIQFHNR